MSPILALKLHKLDLRVDSQTGAMFGAGHYKPEAPHCDARMPRGWKIKPVTRYVGVIPMWGKAVRS